jgi:MYXO-CTERM domain-containing protein
VTVKGGDAPVERFGALSAILACCGVKLVVLAALLAPAGFLTGEVGFAVAGLVLAGLLVAWAVRRRHRCDGTCHVAESPQRERVHTKQ